MSESRSAPSAAWPPLPDPGLALASVLVVTNPTATRYAHEEVRSRIDAAFQDLGRSVRRFEVPLTSDAPPQG